ncbi:TonB-dependent receptor [Sphingomonas sp. CLY1604]|uniref:TonB-dependent receptor n=1 Tax=Sphingomonas sp. CLY1604 TaxID=3457786 RepID=UPI003FD8E771
MSRLGRLLVDVSAGALCVAWIAAPAAAQSNGSVAGQTSPTGSAAGEGTAGVTSPTSTGTDPAAVDAQTSDDSAAKPDDIVVTGIRQSLANAQKIKRNSDTVVDAITATDIGALPDRSVTEALQRVPGVAISRFAGNNDPDHFSVEGSGVNVRGLNFVRSEFNGRDTFSAGVGGQAINFADVPAELLGSVEVYKNATAELIEGGLAGTVNLNTRKPFDNPGFHVGVDAEGNYGDFRKKWSPTGSILVSDTWDTGIGRIGLLADVSYSRIFSRADGIQVTNIQTRDNTSAIAANSTTTTVCRNPLPGTTDTTRLPPNGSACGAANGAGADGLLDPAGLRYAPIGGQFRSQDYDRKRDGIALAAQWQSTDEKTVLTAQFLRTHSTNSWGEHTFETAPDLSEYNTYPLGCRQNSNGPASNGNATVRAECPTGSTTNYTYDSNGLFQSGYITQPGSGYRSSCSATAATCFVPTGGMQQSLSRRQVYDENEVKDFGVNLKTQLSDHLAVNIDGDYTRAIHNNLDVSVFGSTFADEELNLSGKLPVVIPHKPNTLAATWATPNPALVAESDAQYLNDARVQFWRAAMDHIEQSDGREYAFKADFDYKFDEGSFLRNIKVGGRYADRDLDVKYSAYNWGVLSETWSGSNPVSIAQSPANSAFYNFPDFFRGATPGPIGGYFYNGDLIDNYNQSAAYFQQIAQTWRTANGAGATPWSPAASRAGVVAGTPFLPSEIQNVSQQDKNAYAQLNFATPGNLFGDVRMSGNVGVRYVLTDVTSAGSIGAPTRQQTGTIDPFSVRCVTTTTTRPDGTVVVTQPGGACRLGEAGYNALRQFSTGLTSPDVGRNHYVYWLPSANLKFGLGRNLILRLAASKVLTRPDLANIRNFIQVGTDPNTGAPTATAGNPFLKPATAWQFDATMEWYFGRVGQLSIDGFYKSIHNFFYQSLINRDINSNGVTQTVQVRGPANYDGYGKIKGVEVTYQQTFDFLPSFLNGFGTNLNYSYIDSSGLPNSFLNGGSPSGVSNIKAGSLPLEGLSKHNFNATVFYEKGPISLRAAYNWRSKFLLTAADVIFPYTSIFQEGGGQLDASAFLNLTKQIKIGVQGVNLNNQVTRLQQAYINGSDATAPRSYFVNDRRFSFILRGNF